MNQDISKANFMNQESKQVTETSELSRINAAELIGQEQK